MNDQIIIRGAREHNLRNVSLTVPRDKLVVFTGLSGSGKSSLAFDTIYAEGQRRYVESLSSYARQFLGQMEKLSYHFRGRTARGEEKAPCPGWYAGQGRKGFCCGLVVHPVVGVEVGVGDVPGFGVFSCVGVAGDG